MRGVEMNLDLKGNLLTFYEHMAALEKRRCLPCHGIGKRNDAEPGDIYFRTWVCVDCKGTGMRPVPEAPTSKPCDSTSTEAPGQMNKPISDPHES
jgi:DnaJ-class molecular chaperone